MRRRPIESTGTAGTGTERKERKERKPQHASTLFPAEARAFAHREWSGEFALSAGCSRSGTCPTIRRVRTCRGFRPRASGAAGYDTLAPRRRPGTGTPVCGQPFCRRRRRVAALADPAANPPLQPVDPYQLADTRSCGHRAGTTTGMAVPLGQGILRIPFGLHGNGTGACSILPARRQSHGCLGWGISYNGDPGTLLDGADIALVTAFGESRFNTAIRSRIPDAVFPVFPVFPVFFESFPLRRWGVSSRSNRSTSRAHLSFLGTWPMREGSSGSSGKWMRASNFPS